MLKTDGVIAVWTYNLLTMAPALDAIINGFYTDLLGDYWPPERAMVEDGYSHFISLVLGYGAVEKGSNLIGPN